MRKILRFLSLVYLIVLRRIVGISSVVGYLRNPDPDVTVPLLRFFGATIGKNTRFKRSVFFDNVYEDQNSRGDFSNLVVGDNCYIGDCVYFDLSNKVSIGNDDVISGYVSFVTHSDCNRSKCLEKLFPRTCAPILIADNVWIAFKATILNGVSVEKNVVVAAHSLVIENLSQNKLYAGTPAKKVKDLP